MSDRPELAVVIVNFNTGTYLERCLASLERHRGDVGAEILVIDNASHDGSQLAARLDGSQLAAKRDGSQLAARLDVRLVENSKNVYLSPAWNQGAGLTDAPYLLFLNPDTEWWNGTLADFVSIAKTHPRAGIVGPQVRNMDGSVYPSGRPFPGMADAVGHAFLGGVAPGNPYTRRYRLADWDRRTEREVDWVSGCCMLMPRAAYDEVGGFDESFLLYGEELDIASRLRARGWSVLFTPEVEVLHEIGVSTGRSRHSLGMHSASMFRYYRKHRAAGWRRLTLPFAWAALRLRAELEWIRGKVAGA